MDLSMLSADDRQRLLEALVADAAQSGSTGGLSGVQLDFMESGFNLLPASKSIKSPYPEGTDPHKPDWDMPVIIGYAGKNPRRITYREFLSESGVSQVPRHWGAFGRNPNREAEYEATGNDKAEIPLPEPKKAAMQPMKADQPTASAEWRLCSAGESRELSQVLISDDGTVAQVIGDLPADLPETGVESYYILENGEKRMRVHFLGQRFGDRFMLVVSGPAPVQG